MLIYVDDVCYLMEIEKNVLIEKFKVEYLNVVNCVNYIDFDYVEVLVDGVIMMIYFKDGFNFKII